MKNTSSRSLSTIAKSLLVAPLFFSAAVFAADGTSTSQSRMMASPFAASSSSCDAAAEALARMEKAHQEMISDLSSPQALADYQAALRDYKIAGGICR